MAILPLLVQQIEFARAYTNRMLDRTPHDEWFVAPPSCSTNIAWQVGHLAMAQYRLGMNRIRGDRETDETIISSDFLKRFGRESKPAFDRSQSPSAAEIRTVYDRVHVQLLRELAELPEAELDLPTVNSHSLAKTKGEILRWCALHEGIHAGQIGLLRRMLGHPPIW
jgi:hypothetical protein